MKRPIKEFIWVLGAFILSQLIHGLILSNTAMDISLHDTYVVEDGQIVHPTNIFISFIWFIIFGLIVYLTRVLFLEFKITTANVILIAFTALCLYYLREVLFIISPAEHLERPPILSETTTNPSFNHYIAPAHAWFQVFVKIFLITVLTITSFMAGKNAKRLLK